MAATGDDGEYLRHDQGVLGIPATFFPYAFALEEQPEGDQVEAAAAEELGGGAGPGALDMMRFDQVAYWLLDNDPHGSGSGGGGPGALDMMQLDEVAYWLLDLHVDPVFDDPQGGGGGGPGALDMMQLDQVAYWLLDLHVDPVFDNPPGGGGGGPGALDRMQLDEVAYWLLDLHVDPVFDNPHGGGGTNLQVAYWLLDHRLQPYAICDCAAAAGDLSVEYWLVPEPSTVPPPDQLALDGDVILQDLLEAALSLDLCWGGHAATTSLMVMPYASQTTLHHQKTGCSFL